ncbi:putative zinc finger, CCHC-type containing protein [Tanacetum coccineum]
MSGSNFIILVIYVYDILLASNNIDLLHKSKRFLSRNFDMKDLGEASYATGIEIHRDRANGKLGLSQKAYIERVLDRFESNPGILHWKAAKKTLRNAKKLVDQLWDIFSCCQRSRELLEMQRVEEQRISIEHIRTFEMLADPLTKGLPPKVFQGHVAKMSFRQDLT